MHDIGDRMAADLNAAYGANKLPGVRQTVRDQPLRAAIKFDCQHLHRRQNCGVTAQLLDQGKRLNQGARLAGIELNHCTALKPGLDQAFIHELKEVANERREN